MLPSLRCSVDRNGRCVAASTQMVSGSSVPSITMAARPSMRRRPAISRAVDVQDDVPRLCERLARLWAAGV
jgi:hypothetical protein